jgi:hypothetical protein
MLSRIKHIAQGVAEQIEQNHGLKDDRTADVPKILSDLLRRKI